MRAVGYFSIGMGTVLAALFVATPYILESNMRHTLARFGAEHMAAEQAQEMWRNQLPYAVLSLFLGLASIVAGVLMLRRGRWGRYLWIAVCGVFIALHGFGVLQGSKPYISAFWDVFWIATLLVSMVVFRRYGVQSQRLVINEP